MPVRRAVAEIPVRDRAARILRAPSLLTVVLTLAALVPVLKLWRADLAVPFTGYASDANLNTALVKGVIEHGWFLENSSVGVPFGLQLYDFAIFGGDNLHFALLKLLSVFSSDPVVVINLFALLSFPLTALAALFAFRRLGVPAGAAVVCSVLFAVLPYHFERSFSGHLFLGAYWAVPLGCYLVLSVLSGERLISRRVGALGLLAYASRTTLVTLLLCVVIASSGIYYAVFTVILLAVAAPLAAVARRTWAPLLVSSVLGGAIVLVLALNLSPTLAYRIAHGPNPSVGTRLPQESEAFSLKLVHLVLPVPGHRIDRLADARARYDTTALPPLYYGVALGSVGTVGLAALLAVLLGAALGLRGPPVWGERLRHASVLAVVTMLTITVGGASTLVAYALTPQLRAWYRLSVFVAFLALLAVGLLLGAARSRFPAAGPGRLLYVGALGLVLVVGVFDQTTAATVPQYDRIASEYRSDGAFVRAIEGELPARSEVFELPYVAFPEAVLGRMDAYDGARGYIHSRRLRWSWGSMRGRPADWQAALADEPAEVAATAVALSGFEGVWIDRFGYDDSGAQVESRLRSLLEREPLVSGNGRFAFFDLRGLALCERRNHSPGELTGLRTATLRPLGITWGPGFWPVEVSGVSTWRWADRRAELLIHSPSDSPRRVVLDTGVHTGYPRRSTLQIAYPGGRVERIAVSEKARRITRRFEVGPGTSRVVFTTDAPRVAAPADPRKLYITFDAAAAEELPLVQAEREVASPTGPRNPCHT